MITKLFEAKADRHNDTIDTKLHITVCVVIFMKLDLITRYTTTILI